MLSLLIYSRRMGIRQAEWLRGAKPWWQSKWGLQRLPSDQRQAVRLRYLSGKSLEETAVAMGRTPNAVRSLVHRAKQRLHHALRRSSLWLDKR